MDMIRDIMMIVRVIPTMALLLGSVVFWIRRRSWTAIVLTIGSGMLAVDQATVFVFYRFISYYPPDPSAINVFWTIATFYFPAIGRILFAAGFLSICFQACGQKGTSEGVRTIAQPGAAA